MLHLIANLLNPIELWSIAVHYGGLVMDSECQCTINILGRINKHFELD